MPAENTHLGVSVVGGTEDVPEYGHIGNHVPGRLHHLAAADEGCATRFLLDNRMPRN